jgi:hypothetical protein
MSAMHPGPVIGIVNAGIAQNSGPWKIAEAVAAELPSRPQADMRNLKLLAQKPTFMMG